MSITDTITDLMKEGVITLTIGTSPNKMLFVQATQAVQTGPGGTHIQATHQVEDESLVTCLNQINRQVVHTNAIKNQKLVIVPRSN